MKRLIIAAILFGLVITLAVTGNLCVTKTCEEFNRKIDSVTAAPTKETTDNLKDFWEEKSKLLSIFVYREELESVGERIAELYAAYNSGNFEDMETAAQEIRYAVNRITANEKFSLLSMF